MRELTPIQRERYARHLVLPSVGERGQRRLLAATVAIDGTADPATALTACLVLAAAGVGRIELQTPVTPIAERDLARCTVLLPDDIGNPWATAATQHVAALTPDVTVIATDQTPRWPVRWAESPALVIELAGAFALTQIEALLVG